MTDIIFDIDGTLMNVEKRVQWAKKHKKDTDRVMNWDMFLDPLVMLEFDRPNIDVCSIAKSLNILERFEIDLPVAMSNNRIIITSARNERHRDVTMKQLAFAGVRYDSMYLRKDNDFRPDDVVKAELLGKIITDGFDPTVAFDDRNQVVNKWRELGIHCYQVRTGDF